jgi:spore maturation protein CgeB
MRILYLGHLLSGQTAFMRLCALKRLGHQLRGVDTMEIWRRTHWIRRQIQKRTCCGSIVDAINSSIIRAAREFKPEIVWADKQEFLRAETIETLRKTGALLVHFTPDPYFTLEWKRTPIMDESIRHFDVLLYCKKYEKAKYEALDKSCVYMPLGYCDEVHRPLPDPHWSCEVGFLGGWEPRRERMLHCIAASNVNLKFRGAYWDFLCDGRWTLRRHFILKELAAGSPVKIHKDELLAHAYDGTEVYGDDYARALTGSQIGLGFLRTVCPDQHTTRTFEIPACGSLLLADRTDEHKEFFREGKEAEFFDCDEELVDKVRFYKANESARKRTAAAGRMRCVNGGYSYVERLRTVIRSFEQSRN